MHGKMIHRLMIIVFVFVFVFANSTLSFAANESVAELTQKADAGDGLAQFHLAVLYYKGENVKQDYKKAAELFEKAALQGVPDAQYNLGIFYQNGYGVKQDFTKAVEWYEKEWRGRCSEYA